MCEREFACTQCIHTSWNINNRELWFTIVQLGLRLEGSFVILMIHTTILFCDFWRLDISACFHLCTFQISSEWALIEFYLWSLNAKCDVSIPRNSYRNENKKQRHCIQFTSLISEFSQCFRLNIALGMIQWQPVVVETTLKYGSFNNVNLDRMKIAMLHLWLIYILTPVSNLQRH